ncbi:hypothetical protein [Rhodoferax sp. U11-2br]|uniref:hypothetical protein n=1 Tax=Rhodoferax sp. U11-2br TaxID=2838878 RepID=UPI001BEB157F|nr:hypothetical protein [Rhodoferax sp. U11-2br]MBT3068387.1 hypothetical protein [Rhodoferax sp. U11-2br]
MRLSLLRDSVCAADDYADDLEIDLDVSDELTLKDFLDQMLSTNYVQYSSSHMCLVVKSAFDLALMIPADKEVIYLARPERRLSELTKDGKIEFSFSLSRDQQSRYGEHRRRKLGI